MEYTDFNKFCEKGICKRLTIQSKRCLLQSKRQNCYKKYLKKIEKQKSKEIIDQRWKDVKEQLFKRDNNECQLWKIFTKEEQTYILKNYYSDYTFLKELDPCHIKGKGAYPELKYDLDNLVCIRRYFHLLLDQLKHPITRESITNKEREKWFLMAKNQMRSYE